MWFLYVIATVDGFLYTGISTDVERRFKEHVAQGRTAAKYLCCHKPQSLAFSAPIGSRSLALKVEYRFKQLTKKEKLVVIGQGDLLFDTATGRISFDGY